MNFPSMSPGFVAASAGYDVWLGNTRGNTYSPSHTHLDPEKDAKKFYDYDWTDLVKDDKAVISYILAHTQQEKVAYVGHSMGTTQMFTGLSQDEAWFKDKLSIFIALGPVTKITNTTVTVLQIMDHFYREVYDAD